MNVDVKDVLYISQLAMEDERPFTILKLVPDVGSWRVCSHMRFPLIASYILAVAPPIPDKDANPGFRLAHNRFIESLRLVSYHLGFP
jgi:hypothetical protein